MTDSVVKLIGVTIVLGIATVVYYIYNAYRRSIKSSKFALAAYKLGLTGYNTSNGLTISMQRQQEALLRVFQIAGYFKLSSIWCDLNRIGHMDNINKVFEEISAVVKVSNADQTDPKIFNAKYMRKNLFISDNFDLQDALDLLLYIAQHAFNREIGQERYELISRDWIQTFADDYLEEVRLLRLIDRQYPSLNIYDGGWIAGASRVALSQRIIDFNYYIASRNIKISGETLVLAGEREIWANIDGILPAVKAKLLEASENNIDIDTVSLLSSLDDESVRIDEGKAYMMHLARFFNIKLNSVEPFVQYKSKDECPPDRFPNRVYANYDVGETLKLTETLMSRDLLRTYLNNSTNKICIIDTLSENQARPNTTSTARDASERFVKRIIAGEYGDKKDFIILFCTNNPYIERQTLATQQQVNQVLEDYNLAEKGYTIKIEGVGFSCKQPLAVVHSELGALITEKWKAAVAAIEKSDGLKPKRDIKNLLFQTRDKNVVTTEEPSVNINRKSDIVKDWFDSYLTLKKDFATRPLKQLGNFINFSELLHK